MHEASCMHSYALSGCRASASTRRSAARIPEGEQARCFFPLSPTKAPLDAERAQHSTSHLHEFAATSGRLWRPVRLKSQILISGITIPNCMISASTHYVRVWAFVVCKNPCRLLPPLRAFLRELQIRPLDIYDYSVRAELGNAHIYFANFHPREFSSRNNMPRSSPETSICENDFTRAPERYTVIARASVLWWNETSFFVYVYMHVCVCVYVSAIRVKPREIKNSMLRFLFKRPERAYAYASDAQCHDFTIPNNVVVYYSSVLIRVNYPCHQDWYQLIIFLRGTLAVKRNTSLIPNKYVSSAPTRDTTGTELINLAFCPTAPHRVWIFHLCFRIKVGWLFARDSCAGARWSTENATAMTLPVSSYEELLIQVRELTHETILLQRQLSSDLFDNADPPDVNHNFSFVQKNYEKGEAMHLAVSQSLPIDLNRRIRSRDFLRIVIDKRDSEIILV